MGSLRSLRRRERPEPVPPTPTDAELIHCVQCGTFKQVKALLERGANPNAADIHRNTALAHAANRGNLGMVQVLVKNGADVNRKNHLGTAPLSLAIASPWPMSQKICRHLLDRGVDINASNRDGNTPLMIAAIFQRFDFAKLLLERGADPKIRNRDSKRAVDMIGHGRGSKELLKLLKHIS